MVDGSGRSDKSGGQARHARAHAVRCGLACLFIGLAFWSAPRALAQETAKGGIRGVVYDADFNVPVPAVKVSIPEVGRESTTTEDGHYAFPDVAPGIYTVVFTKDGFQRETRINVLVFANAFADVDTRLFGEYTDMDELVVSDIDLGGGTEAGLLNIQQTSATMMNSVGADLIARAGQTTAAGALRLVAGASVEGGKYAVIRGLGDRYTSTQINAVRLPSADPDKRAVQLDQFPSALIESIQVNKTFLPDQQGDSGGGTINIVTRSVPETRILSFKIGTAYKPGITGNDDFRWNPRGMDYWGVSDRDLPVRSETLLQNAGTTAGYDLDAMLTKSLDKRVATTTEAPPPDHNWGITVGDVYTLGDDWSAGGLGSFSYSQKFEGHNGGLVQNAEQQYGEKNLQPIQDSYPKNSYPETESVGVEKILWGGVATVGLRKGDEQDFGLTFMGNHAADSYAQEYLFSPFNFNGDDKSQAYKEILDYLERNFYTVQEHGRNTLPFFENWNAVPGVLSLHAPVLEWTFAQSDSHFYEPDRTVTSAVHDETTDVWSDPSCLRTWTTIDEQSRQFFFSLKEPFENWTDDKGYVKAGYFQDDVTRRFTTDYLWYSSSYNAYQIPNPYGLTFDKNNPYSNGPAPIWDSLYSYYLGNLGAPDMYGTLVNQGQIVPNQPPIDYTGEQRIRAWYTMGEIPVLSWLRVLGGVRTESTFMQTRVQADVPAGDPGHTIGYYKEDFTDYPGARTIAFSSELDSDAGSDLNHTDVLPAFGIILKPLQEMQLRLNYSQTMARPTFKELTPVATPIQGTSDLFIGNPGLKMSSMDNYDARLEVFPGKGDIVAVSAFLKRIKDPIDRVLVENAGMTAYFPINYQEATLKGVEAECRQALGAWWRTLDGVSVGANGTLLQSELMYDQYSVAEFKDWSGNKSRAMSGQPDYLANLNATYDIAPWGLSLNVFYNFQGRTLVAGEATVPGDAGPSYIPNVYQKPVGTLNTSVSKTLWENWKLSLGAKNLLRPRTTQYYEYKGAELNRIRYGSPIEYAFNLEGKW